LSEASATMRIRSGLRTDEGALSFAIFAYCIYSDSPYKREWGRGKWRKALV
jgi:hypothetical protein